MLQNAGVYRRIAVMFLARAEDPMTAGERERDGFIAAAIYYQKLAHAIEDRPVERTLKDA